MAELTLQTALPGSTQTETEWMLPKAALHPSLEPSAENTLEALLSALIWQLKESGVLPQEELGVTPERNLAIVAGRDQLDEDFDTGEQFYIREVTVRLREPFTVPGFNASNY